VASYQVFYSGRVQGVGFRYSVKRLAASYEVVGWVRNLPDGRVELQIEGEKTEVDDFLAEIAKSSLRHHVQQIETHPIDPMTSRTGFVIEH
jgi:acylphosphatase